jgi:uridine kinase
MFDVKIFVHADSDERLMRRLKRDIAERGRDMEEVLIRYQTTFKPAVAELDSVLEPLSCCTFT